MKRLLAATATLSLLAAAGPALAAPSTYGACKAKEGGTVVKAGGKGYEETFLAPAGAGAGLAADNPQDVGSFYLDLAGKPLSTRGKLTLTLAWSNPVSDYDLIVGGTNQLSSDNPEVVDVKAAHCKPLRVGVDVFVGAPVDELTLTVKGA